MAFNGDETEAVGEAHKPNSYFEAFDGIVAALDALAKAVTPDDGDDGTPPEEGARPCCNSYFASFRNITEALERLKSAVEERIAAGGGIDEERSPSSPRPSPCLRFVSTDAGALPAPVAFFRNGLLGLLTLRCRQNTR